jgi:hypothetical protein
MTRNLFVAAVLSAAAFASSASAWAGQAPTAASTDIPISHHDRVYAAEQFSNTVSVADPRRQQAARRHSAGGSGVTKTYKTLPKKGLCRVSAPIVPCYQVNQNL